MKEEFQKWCEREGVDPYTPKGHYMHRGAYLGFCAGWKVRSQQTPEIITLKNLFRAYAADIEKVANEILEPSTLTRVQVPPEVIDCWLEHLEMIVTVDAK
jgi:hypothetical protein